MATYLEQLSNRIEINKRKLASLEEYKKSLLNSNEEIDKDLLADRLNQINEEFAKLKKAIHANQKAEAHYSAALNHLIDLRTLDDKLQRTQEGPEQDDIIEQIKMHTNKLERHLAILPEKLVTELQEQYLKYTKENPLVVEEEPVEEIPLVAGTFTDSVIYKELLEVFEAEKREFDQIKVFDSPEELENFLQKYHDMKMMRYSRFAVINNIGKSIAQDDLSEINTQLKETAEEPELAPIVVMLSLVDGLEIGTNPERKLHATNVRISEGFKDELQDANWLYNVIHQGPEIAEVSKVSFEEFMASVAQTAKNKERIDVVNKRIADLSKKTLQRIYNEYYGASSNNRLTTVLKVLITEKAND